MYSLLASIDVTWMCPPRPKLLLLNIGVGYHRLLIYLKVSPKMLLSEQEDVIKYEKKMFFSLFLYNSPPPPYLLWRTHHPFGANFSKEVSN